MLHALCSASNLRAREKKRKTSVQADSQGHVSPVSQAYDVLFGLSTLISNRILFHNLCKIEYPASRTLEHEKRRCYADVPFLRATTEIGDVCTQAMETIVQWFTFVLWCGFYSVSFQSFVLCHLLFATNCNIFLHLCYIAVGTAVMLPSNLNNRQVSDTLLHDLVEDLSTSWKMLGRRLGIPEGAITNIDMEHRRVVEKGMAMFAEWKRRRGEGATVGVLREALDKTGRRDLSERVRGT